MSFARPRVALEFVDGRGNVVVAVESGARFGGTLRRMVDVLEVGSTHDIMLIFGDEPATMSVSVVHGAEITPGAIVQVEVVTVDVGGIRLAPPPAAPSSAMAMSLLPSRAGLTGHLSELPMAELIQLLCATRRTATIEITVGNDVVGEVAFADGRAIYAHTTGGALGVEAFYGLAALERGEFSVFYGRAAPSVNVNEDTLFLLLEAARRADEARRVVEDALAVGSLTALEHAIDGALPSSPAQMPPPRRRQRRPADAGGDVTNPGRRPQAPTGLFSGFFNEFSEARGTEPADRVEPAVAPTLARVERAPVEPARTAPVPRVEPARTAPVARLERRPEARSERPLPPPPPSLGADEQGLRVVRLSALRTDDLVAAPPFASLAFAADHSGITGEHDTDIIVHQQSSAG